MFKRLWNHSWLNYLIKYLANLSDFRQDKKAYSEILYGGFFALIASKYLNIELDKDWIGRLYGVVNPNVDINGNFDPGSVIIEIDGDNTNSNEYVKTWIYRQLRLMSAIYSLKDLYNKLTIDISKVGPEEFDNYLIVFDLESRQNKVFWRKKLLARTSFWIFVAAIVLITAIIII